LVVEYSDLLPPELERLSLYEILDGELASISLNLSTTEISEIEENAYDYSKTVAKIIKGNFTDVEISEL